MAKLSIEDRTLLAECVTLELLNERKKSNQNAERLYRRFQQACPPNKREGKKLDEVWTDYRKLKLSELDNASTSKPSRARCSAPQATPSQPSSSLLASPNNEDDETEGDEDDEAEEEVEDEKIEDGAAPRPGSSASPSHIANISESEYVYSLRDHLRGVDCGLFDKSTWRSALDDITVDTEADHTSSLENQEVTSYRLLRVEDHLPGFCMTWEDHSKDGEPCVDFVESRNRDGIHVMSNVGTRLDFLREERYGLEQQKLWQRREALRTVVGVNELFEDYGETLLFSQLMDRYGCKWIDDSFYHSKYFSEEEMHRFVRRDRSQVIAEQCRELDEVMRSLGLSHEVLTRWQTAHPNSGINTWEDVANCFERAVCVIQVNPHARASSVMFNEKHRLNRINVCICPNGDPWLLQDVRPFAIEHLTTPAWSQLVQLDQNTDAVEATDVRSLQDDDAKVTKVSELTKIHSLQEEVDSLKKQLGDQQAKAAKDQLLILSLQEEATKTAKVVGSLQERIDASDSKQSENAQTQIDSLKERAVESAKAVEAAAKSSAVEIAALKAQLKKESREKFILSRDLNCARNVELGHSSLSETHVNNWMIWLSMIVQSEQLPIQVHCDGMTLPKWNGQTRWHLIPHFYRGECDGPEDMEGPECWLLCLLDMKDADFPTVRPIVWTTCDQCSCQFRYYPELGHEHCEWGDELESINKYLDRFEDEGCNILDIQRNPVRWDQRASYSMINCTRLFIDLIRINRDPEDNDIERLCKAPLQDVQVSAIVKELLTIKFVQQQQKKKNQP